MLKVLYIFSHETKFKINIDIKYIDNLGLYTNNQSLVFFYMVIIINHGYIF